MSQQEITATVEVASPYGLASRLRRPFLTI